MHGYVGIDLGTTNSAICSYDGAAVRLHLSPEQTEVTPSAIYINNRGARYVGRHAYDQSALSPDNAAVGFKRLMGTSTPVRLPAVGVTMTPEECSAEILKVLFGYLPEEIRDGEAAGTVITVPAAFNQMQKDATLAAAGMAGIGRVALMQEPVAAVMSVMRQHSGDGVFLIYDLGGGTLDVALAESMGGRVSLLAHGGIAMCGGRDIDRSLRDALILPWLRDRFDLPADLLADPAHRRLLRLAEHAAERAKIELSSREDAIIALDEAQLGARDAAGRELFLDIPLRRAELDALAAPLVASSVAAVRETLAKAGLSARDVGRIVFVGGPTQYKPLRDKVAAELGIAPSTDVKPMTAVAEGAAVFAESIDWSTASRGRKRSRATLDFGGALEMRFTYAARTPDARSRVALAARGAVAPGAEFQIDSLDTGWSSGRLPLADGAICELPLARPGENLFKVFVFGPDGGVVALQQDRLTITRTAATVDAIPASHAIGIEVLSRTGGKPVIEYLVQDGEMLPKKGRLTVKAAASLRSGAATALRFKLWEGGIADPITDNRFIGTFEIGGRDFSDGVIAAGADLVCDYEVLDSGNVVLEVSVPSIGNSFQSGRNFYSRQQAQIDFSQSDKLVAEEGEALRKRITAITTLVEDRRLDEALDKVERGVGGARPADPEGAKKAHDDIQDAKRLLAQTRRDHLRAIRGIELARVVDYFDNAARQHARPIEAEAFDNLVRTARRAIDAGSPDFESYLEELRHKYFDVLWKQDWFVIDRFRWLADSGHLFPDAAKHAGLAATGTQALDAGDMPGLRRVVAEMDNLRFIASNEADLMAAANIIRS
ncbi:MAG TPA: Hsp70 family protein [Roseomonas sp.]|jgi:molecular chaperone DnaK